jgi:hypothetical protein
MQMLLTLKELQKTLDFSTILKDDLPSKKSPLKKQDINFVKFEKFTLEPRVSPTLLSMMDVPSATLIPS